MRNLKHLLLNMALVAMSVLLTTLFCELGLRVAGYPSPGDFKNPPTGPWPRFYYKADPTNGHDIAENFPGDLFLLPDYIHTYGAPYPVSSNSVGCRDRSIDTMHDYVLLLGDSFTWGFVPLEETWGATLEQGIGVRTLNCGVSGYGPRQERHKLDTVVVRAGRPRLVIVGYFMNDLLDDYLFPARTVIDGYVLKKVVLDDRAQGVRRVLLEKDLRERLTEFFKPKRLGAIGRTAVWLRTHSVVYDLIEQSHPLRRLAVGLGLSNPSPRLSGIDAFAFRSVTEFPWLERAWEEHLENLRQLNAAVNALGAKMLVVIFPDKRQVYDSLRPHEHGLQWEYANQRLAEFFRQEQIAFLDLLPEFKGYGHCSGNSRNNPGGNLYWAHDSHLNVTGNRLAGLLVSRWVLEGSFVEDDDKRTKLSDVNQRLSAEARC